MSTTATLPSAPLTSGALAYFLREHDLPGRRSMTAIERLRRERRRRNAPVAPPPPVSRRLDDRLLADACAEILRRGGEVVVSSENYDKPLAIVDRDRGRRMLLLHVAGWRYYGRRSKYRWATLSYLCGHDDAGPWAVRVAGTVETVAGALAWITPREVQDAIAAGRRVLRQGDVYAVETSPARDGTGDLPDAHRWNPTTRYLTHHPDDGRKHRQLRVSFPARFVVQRAYEMGRSGARADGD